MPKPPSIAVVKVPLRWVRAPHARRYLGGVSVRTWRRMLEDGLVKGIPFGKMVLYDLTALDRAVLRGARRDTTAPPSGKAGPVSSGDVGKGTPRGAAAQAGRGGA